MCRNSEVQGNNLSVFRSFCQWRRLLTEQRLAYGLSRLSAIGGFQVVERQASAYISSKRQRHRQGKIMIHSEFSAMGSSITRAVRWCTLLLAVVVIAGASVTKAQTIPPGPGPSIFFTDLTSGPNAGGENVSGFAGAYVTIYGNNFGATQGTSTITWNGLNCLRVVSWGTSYLWYQKIVVQVGSSCSPGTGTFVVTANGQASTAVRENISGGTQIPSQFTVRSTGNIHCVSTSGNDNNPGTFSGGCWATIVKGRQISAGDVTYVENGVSQTATDGFASLTATGTGTAANPIALAVYPGATATIGATTGNDGVRFCTGYSACSSGGSYWIISGFILRGSNAAISISNGTGNLRFVGNDISCPNGDGSTACVTSNSSSFTFLYGNHVHDAGKSTSVKTYHAVYLSTDLNHNWLGWNSVHNVLGCRGIQFYSTGGSDQFDLHVHDNLVHDIRCDGINFATINPNNGPVEAYNNVIYNAGQGPDPVDGGSVYTCIRGSSSGTVPVEIYNNTMYNCGSIKNSAAGVFDFNNSMTRFRNNLIFQTSGETYTLNTNCPSYSGSNNLWYGLGAPPCTLTGDLNVNPQLTNPAAANFQLLSASSPANGAGIAIGGLTSDFAGLLHPSPPSIGAYEFTSASAAALPAPPTNLIVVVQ